MKGAISLTEKESDVLAITDDSTDIGESQEFILVARILTNKKVWLHTFQNQMAEHWDGRFKVNIKEHHSGLFLLCFGCEGDQLRALEKEPWHFQNHHIVLLQPTLLLNVTPDIMIYTPFWVQAYRLPFLSKSKALAKALASILGEFVAVHEDSLNEGWGPFLRFRVRLDITRPLLRGRMVTLPRIKDEFWVEFRYERLPDYCMECGIIGHLYQKCPIFLEKLDLGVEPELAYGPSLKGSRLPTSSYDRYRTDFAKGNAWPLLTRLARRSMTDTIPKLKTQSLPQPSVLLTGESSKQGQQSITASQFNLQHSVYLDVSTPPLTYSHNNVPLGPALNFNPPVLNDVSFPQGVHNKSIPQLKIDNDSFDSHHSKGKKALGVSEAKEGIFATYPPLISPISAGYPHQPVTSNLNPFSYSSTVDSTNCSIKRSFLTTDLNETQINIPKKAPSNKDVGDTLQSMQSTVQSPITLMAAGSSSRVNTPLHDMTVSLNSLKTTSITGPVAGMSSLKTFSAPGVSVGVKREKDNISPSVKENANPNRVFKRQIDPNSMRETLKRCRATNTEVASAMSTEVHLDHSARYFRTHDFLTASSAGVSSLTWQGICFGKELLIKGLRLHVGNGMHIRCGSDPWIPAQTRFTPVFFSGLEGNIVADYISADHQWDIDKLTSDFSALDVENILKIPLSHNAGTDSWVWHYTDAESYTVNSGYHLACSMASQEDSSCSSASSTWWKQFWNLNLPSKVKIFAWRVMHNALPSASNLHHRRIINSSTCSLCTNAWESIGHALFSCKHAKAVWRCSDFSFDFTAASRMFEGDFLIQLSQLHTKSDLEMIICTMWFIWSDRNNIIHQKQHKKPADLLASSKAYYCNFLQQSAITASLKQVDPAVAAHCPWTPPTEGKIKLNVDAAVLSSQNKLGYGALIRDSTGTVLAACSSPANGNFKSKHMEAKALFHALRWANQLNYQVNNVETDSLVLVNAIHASSLSDLSYRDLILDVKINYPTSLMFVYLMFVEMQTKLLTVWLNKL
uniref:CCHC-type domain-containing protein n=1 Tax=Cannabis sativa TaxID=3483 RepID=A0A803NN93_CANSA